MTDGVEGRAARGAALTLIGSTPANLLSVLLTIACARWLTPSAFGAYSLALAIFGISDMLTNPAAGTYLLSRPGCDDRTIDAAWTLTALRGVLLSGVFFLLAPLVGSAFGGTEQTTTVLRILALRFAIGGLSNLHTVRLQHELKYGLIVMMDAGASIIGSVLSIVFLLWLKDPSGLAAGLIVGSVASCLASWLLAPRHARPTFDSSELRKMWAFTRYLSINALIVYALLNLDDLIVSRLTGAAALGVYALSYRVVNTAVLFVLQPLGQILLPALAQLREDAQRFGDACLRAVSAFACVSWFITASCAVVAGELFALLAPGSDWAGAVPIFRALLPFVLTRGINSAMGAMLLAAGKPSVLTRISGTQLLLMVPSAWLGYRLHGFLGLTVALSVLNAGATLALVAVAPRHAQLARSWLFGLIVLPLPSAVGAAAAGTLLRPLLGSPFTSLLISIPVMAIVYLGLWEGSARLIRRQAPAAVSAIDLARLMLRRSQEPALAKP